MSDITELKSLKDKGTRAGKETAPGIIVPVVLLVDQAGNEILGKSEASPGSNTLAGRLKAIADSVAGIGSVKIVDENSRILEFDNLFRAMLVQSLEHHEIHEGRHFFIGGFETLGLNVELEFVFQVPETTRLPHIRFFAQGTDRIEYYYYDGTTDIVGGTAITPVNNNRSSANVSGLTVLKDPTSITAGSLIESASMGANNSTGRITREDELIWDQLTNQTIRFISKGAGNVVTYLFSWYEHIGA